MRNQHATHMSGIVIDGRSISCQAFDGDWSVVGRFNISPQFGVETCHADVTQIQTLKGL